jgi:hypothetical protein
MAKGRNAILDHYASDREFRLVGDPFAFFAGCSLGS